MISYRGGTIPAFVSQTAPKTFYKYVDEHAANCLAQGKVQLRRLSAFRGIEGQPVGVQDPMEGRARLVAMDLLITETSDPDLQKTVRGHFDVRGTDGIFLNHVHLTGETLNYWVLCLTCHPTSFWADRPYAWQIDDILGLVNALMRAAPLDLPHGRVGSVRYEERVGDLAVDYKMSANPLVKEPKFAWQKEERAFFDPGRETISDVLDIDCPEVSKFSSIVHATIDEHPQAKLSFRPNL